MIRASELIGLKRSSNWGARWKSYEVAFSTGDIGPFLFTLNPFGDKSYVLEVGTPIHTAEGYESDCAHAFTEQK